MSETEPKSRRQELVSRQPYAVWLLAHYLIRVVCVNGRRGLWSSTVRLSDRQRLRREDRFERPRST